MTNTKREEEQDTRYIEELAELFRAEGYDAHPIVLVENEILDGHHRHEAALLAGVEADSVVLTGAEYEALRDVGFDDTEIAYAAHIRVRDYDAADCIDAKFGGAGVRERGEAAAELI